jgi:hypothetical protein
MISLIIFTLKDYEMDRVCSTHEEKRNAYRVLVGRSEGLRKRFRPRRRWKGYIKTDLREIEWGGTDWIDLAQIRDQWRVLYDTVMNLRVP